MRVAVVTGSGKKRVGYHVAKALATDGYAVALHYRSSAAEAQQVKLELRNLGAECEAYQANLADEDDVRKFSEAVFARFGRVDLLANCAAVWDRKSLEEINAKDVREQFDTNALGTFLCCQQFGLAMAKQSEGGSIVLIGDWADVRPYPGYAAYFPSKNAIPGMTRLFAVELGTRNPNLRVNAILPGPVMLPADLPEEERREAIEATLVKREGNPKNIVQAVQFFAQNDFVTGVCLPVDGGRTIYAGGR
jgi:pteridine reductase